MSSLRQYRFKENKNSPPDATSNARMYFPSMCDFDIQSDIVMDFHLCVCVRFCFCLKYSCRRWQIGAGSQTHPGASLGQQQRRRECNEKAINQQQSKFGLQFRRWWTLCRRQRVAHAQNHQLRTGLRYDTSARCSGEERLERRSSSQVHARICKEEKKHIIASGTNIFMTEARNTFADDC